MKTPRETDEYLSGRQDYHEASAYIQAQFEAKNKSANKVSDMIVFVLCLSLASDCVCFILNFLLLFVRIGNEISGDLLSYDMCNGHDEHSIRLRRSDGCHYRQQSARMRSVLIPLV